MKTEEDRRWGSFSLDHRIEVSAMAEVFLVHRGDDDRPYVLKRPTVDRRDDPTAAALFAHEQYLTARVKHPNLVRSVDSGDIDGWPYLLLEHRPGVPLVRILAAAVQAGQRLSEVSVIHLALQLVRALEALHTTCDAGGSPLDAIHMDLAPHNVLVSTNDGQVTLLDLGIARSRRLSRELPPVHGRPAYLAPEQIVLTDPPDARVDIFAFGTLIHECLRCQPLFRAATEEQTRWRILHAPIPEIPRNLRQRTRLAAILRRSLARAPAERYPSTTVLADDLSACAEHLDLPAQKDAIRDELSALLAVVVAREAARKARGLAASISGSVSKQTSPSKSPPRA